MLQRRLNIFNAKLFLHGNDLAFSQHFLLRNFSQKFPPHNHLQKKNKYHRKTRLTDLFWFFY